MPKLELLLKDGGIEEFETVPVQDDKNQNPAIPTASNQGTTIFKTAIIVGLGRQVVNSSISLIGETTGDYALERKVKGGLTGLAFGGAFLAAPVLTGGGIAIQQGSEAFLRNRAIMRKQIKAAENKQLIGKVVSNNARVGGQK